MGLLNPSVQVKKRACDCDLFCLGLGGYWTVMPGDVLPKGKSVHYPWTGTHTAVSSLRDCLTITGRLGLLLSSGD